jgi:hypothetical protein
MAQSQRQGPPAQEAAHVTERLLEWMSFRRTGKISDIPAELAEGNVRTVLNGLATLGHVELLPNENWMIAPPVLAGLPSQPDGAAIAILCGARTPGLLTSLNTACANASVLLETIERPQGPAVVSVTAGSERALSSVASVAGLPFQHDAALALLACTPSIREWPRKPCPMVGGRVETVQRFSKSQLKWIESSLDDATAATYGFFRIKRDWDRVSLLKTGVSECAYIDDRAGRLTVAAKLKAVSWTADTRSFGLPSQLIPPVLIARALTLCSGFLPHYESVSRRISFSGVPPEILRLTLAITGLRLA